MPEYTPKELVTLQVADLIPYERNPKTHPESQIQLLANSIREWGWTMPILIDEANTVIAGHGRLYAAKELEITEVPCLIAVDWSEEQKSAYVIADNKLAEHGEWNMGMYFSELKNINEVGFNMDLLGVGEDFTALNFNPSLDPKTSYSDITSSDVEKANNVLSNQLEAISSDNAMQGIEAMCPDCGTTFRFTGA